MAVPDGVKIGSDILYPNIRAAVKKNSKVMMITDRVVEELYGRDVYRFLEERCREVKLEIVRAGSLREALLMAYYIVNRDYDAVVAMGGGKVLDVGKYAASMAKKTFISIPTSISHDGVASPIAVLKCDHGSVRSLDCKIPDYIIMDITLIKKAPENLILAGVGDLVSNITALKDWDLATERGKAKMDDFAYIISRTAVRAVVQYKNPTLKDDAFLTQLAESIVLSGLAMSITGNTRPSSGAEHLISHAIDQIGKGTLHGLQTAVASIFAEYLHGGDYDALRSFLKGFGIPTTFAELGLDYADFAKVIKLAPATRKNRYTILDEISFSDEELKRIYDTVYG